MSEQLFDVVNRQAAAATSRRRSLLAIGSAGAAIAALARPSIAAGKKKTKRDPNKACKQQIGRCKASWEDVCEDLNCEPAVLAGLLACCGLLRTCDIPDYNTCVLATLF